MSGFSANSSTGGLPEPSFFSFCPAALATRQSATAAANTAASAGKAAITALRICIAVSTRTTSTPLGGGTCAGPVTNVILAPRSRSAAAIAVPCAPDDRLAMNLTGSIGSCVGPEVTSTCRPSKGPSASTLRIASKIASGSAIRPGPNSPQAISPSSGPTNRTPSACTWAMLRWVAACSHIRTFIAGATSTGVSVASNRVEARSSARPPAILASKSAVPGATTIRSALRDNSICPISASSVRSNSA